MQTAWSDAVTIISVLLFFTVRMESAVGSENMHEKYIYTPLFKTFKYLQLPVELMRQKMMAASPPHNQRRRKSMMYHVRVSQNSNTK